VLSLRVSITQNASLQVACEAGVAPTNGISVSGLASKLIPAQDARFEFSNSFEIGKRCSKLTLHCFGD